MGTDRQYPVSAAAWQYEPWRVGDRQFVHMDEDAETVGPVEEGGTDNVGERGSCAMCMASAGARGP